MGWPRFEPVLDVLRGRERVDEELSRWIERRYGIPIVDVIDDPMDGDLGPRLAVWTRTPEQAVSFRDGAGFDPVKQREIAERAGRPGDLVIFCAADEVLRERALGAVGEAEYAAAARGAIDDPSALWKAYPLFGQVFVWVLTDAQRDAVRGSEQFERLADALWRLVHERDEFGVVPREGFAPRLDSKQNLDENFAGNSYYYHR